MTSQLPNIDDLRRHAIALEASLCRDSFADFARLAWHVVEPTRAVLPSTALDAMCVAAQAVGDGRLKRLAVSTCPGTAKSLVWCVLFPAWLLLRTEGRARIMCGAYTWSFATRDSKRCRDLVRSTWYRRLVAGLWSLRDDSDRGDDWWTTATGRRLVASPAGQAIGERCTFQIVDEALSGADIYSSTTKAEAVRWIREVLSTRLEDPDKDCRVVVGQRLCVDDPISSCIELGWKYLYLPATIGESDPCVLLDDAGIELWRDSRSPDETVSGLLSHDALAERKRDLGSSAFAAQYLQRPHDDSSAMFPRAWFARRWTELPDKLERQVITLDASFKDGDQSDYAVIQCWASKGADRYLVEQWRKQAGFVDTLTALRRMHASYPLAKILVEGAANGHAVLDQLGREIAGVVEVKPEGGKSARAATVQPICESGSIVLPDNAPWVEPWIDEVSAFPGGKHDDQVDAMVYALRDLQGTNARKTWRAFNPLSA